ncbi:hypothetical protein LTR09_007445 [Extremus antarcticus]|uniref:Cell wall protein SED1 n=1 Tax=Extremus antarcticus TaxID=702011 RepID=A0AAJ0DJ69_9PEZI|nr:hypothetical protein LTR09_007445 [Extremus antarcticus]
MRSAVVAAFAGVAAASWAPQEHGQPGGSWGSPAAPAPVNETAPAYGGDSWTTEVVTAWTTFCPKATEITHGGQTYTATEATTLVITNCPGGCTVSYPATSWATTAPVTTEATTAPVTTQVPTTWETSVAPVTTAPPAVPYPVGNTTIPASTASPVASTASSYPSSPVPATGAAAQLSAGAAAVFAIFGLVAAL